MSDDALKMAWETQAGRSDAEELALRRQRAATEKLALRAITTSDPIFADFAVWHADREDSTRYGVEMRSLSEQGNWCDCPDFHKNGLGSCKHVMFILQQEAFREADKRQSPWVEVALVDGVPTVTLPAGVGEAEAALVRDWCAEDGRLLSPWQHVLSQFLTAVDAASPAVRRRFRVSAGVRGLADAMQRRQRREAARERTEEELRREGCERLVGKELSPVQLVGALHLAFAGRAILADDSVHEPRLQALAAAQLLRERGEARRLLVLAAASELPTWEKLVRNSLEIPATNLAEALKDGSTILTLTTPEAVAEQISAVNSLLQPDLIIVDDAGACCPLKSERSRQLKKLRSTNLFALYPAELTSDLDAIYSIVDWVAPTLLGSLFRFNRDFREIDEAGNWGQLRDADALSERLRPVWLRRGQLVVGSEPRRRPAGGAAADAFAGELQMRVGGEIVLLRAELAEAGFLTRGLLVVKQTTPRLEAAIADSWRRTHGDKQRHLMVVTESQWQAVAQLQRGGWLTPTTGGNCRDLLGRPVSSELSRTERLRMGQHLLAEAQRLHKVAQLLRDGGCAVEAVRPARQAVLALGRLLAWLHLDGLGGIPEQCSGGLVAQLRTHSVLSAPALRVLTEARDADPVGELRAQWFLRQVDELFAESAPRNSGQLGMPPAAKGNEFFFGPPQMNLPGASPEVSVSVDPSACS